MRHIFVFLHLVRICFNVFHFPENISCSKCNASFLYFCIQSVLADLLTKNTVTDLIVFCMFALLGNLDVPYHKRKDKYLKFVPTKYVFLQIIKSYLNPSTTSWKSVKAFIVFNTRVTFY